MRGKEAMCHYRPMQEMYDKVGKSVTVGVIGAAVGGILFGPVGALSGAVTAVSALAVVQLFQ